MNTSLQNIITSEKTSLRDDDIRLLFRPRQFPSFQLTEFRKKDELMKKERFHYFIKILEKWNQRVADRDQTLNDCVYTKNEFIFSWLKSLAVQSSKQIDASLSQLYGWYTSSKSTEPACFLRKEPSKKVHLQEWEIRNSYKSNLPLEIDNYKRRLVAVPQQPLENSQTRSQQLSPTTANFPLSAQKQNNFLRNNRQAQQMKAYMNNYRKSKVYFYRNMAKNYYQSDFQRDKLSTSSGFYQPKADIHLQIKNYRIKTTMGQRQFSTPNHQMNRTCFSNFSNSSVHLQPLGKESMQVQIPTCNIDGIGLINNPFQLKIKKKKK